jgi:hypothetical protein
MSTSDDIQRNSDAGGSVTSISVQCVMLLAKDLLV